MTQPRCAQSPRPEAAELRSCDLVMEGGVTSAVIYAAMVSQLSRDHRLHALGGASSGAVAATAAAVAEAARHRSGNRNAFAKLDAFIQEMKSEDAHGRTGLRRLFQPAPPLRPAFAVVIKALEISWKGRPIKACGQLLWTLVNRFPLAASLGFVLALATQIGRAILPPDPISAAWLLGVLFTLLIGASLSVVMALVAFLGDLARHLPSNHLGLCRGLSTSGPAPSKAQPEAKSTERRAQTDRPLAGSEQIGGLTDELHVLFNGLYGRGPEEEPVTFSDLWNPCSDPAQPPGVRKIDLQVITTALQLRRPFRLPGDAQANPHPLAPFFYDPQEWKHFFPESVMRWLSNHAPHCDLTTPTGAPLSALPPPADWPVLMAARLSLSFPLLLSAVPMYTLWRGHGVFKPGDGSPVRFRPQRVFLSDGGITSNCPIDLFDKPLPGHPTFIINLYTSGDADVTPRLSTRFSDPESKPAPVPPGGWRAVVDLLLRIVDTSLGWRDSLARTMPGYRERVLNIGVPQHLGGLNLCMSGNDIGKLAELGKAGAETLRGFSVPRDGRTHSGWDQHRWLRLRTALSALSAHHRTLVECACRGLPAYRTLLDTRPQPEPQLVGDEAWLEAQRLLEALESLSAAGLNRKLEQNSPEPLPDLRMQLQY